MIRVNYNGRLGNLITQYIVARYYAERINEAFSGKWPLNRDLPIVQSGDIELQPINGDTSMFLDNPNSYALIESGRRSETAAASTVFDGYFFDQRLFPGRDKARSYFEPIMGDPIDRVVLALRLGDYRHWQGGSILDPEYYRDAYDSLQGVDGLPVVITTDEYRVDYLSKLKSYPAFEDAEVICRGLPNFTEIARSKFVISANSSFSFWAAWLGHAEKLIFPRLFFKGIRNSGGALSLTNNWKISREFNVAGALLSAHSQDAETAEIKQHTVALMQSIARVDDLTILTMSKGRLHHLKQALPTMLEQQCQVILVDYDCPDGSGHWARMNFPEWIKSGRLYVYNIKDRPIFNMPEIINFGFQQAKTPWVWISGADMTYQPGFAREVSRLMRPRHYIDFVKSKDNLGFYGAYAIEKSVFDECGGYDTDLKGYGYADTDFKTRLAEIGVGRVEIERHWAAHIHHGMHDRIKFYNENTSNSWERNRGISEAKRNRRIEERRKGSEGTP